MNKTWQVWIEGYRATGGSAKAQNVGEVEAATFREACDILCSPAEWQEQWGTYNAERGTVWGCRLFDNEVAARRSFG